MTIAHVLCQNRLLRLLPEEDRSRLAKGMRLIKMSKGEHLYGAGDQLETIFFPISATVSVLYELEDGVSAEVAVVGNEGFAGISRFLSCGTTLSRATVNREGLALVLGGAMLTKELRHKGPLLQVLMRYIQALIMEMAQSLVCIRHHSLEQQFCRWLLGRFDRLPSGNHDLVMSQEMIANTLGTRRNAISEVAVNLQKAGLINYRRGKISLINRPEIETRSCKCYVIVKEQFDRLLIKSAGS